jgi:hypothetical protein
MRSVQSEVPGLAEVANGTPFCGLSVSAGSSGDSITTGAFGSEVGMEVVTDGVGRGIGWDFGASGIMIAGAGAGCAGVGIAGAGIRTGCGNG